MKMPTMGSAEPLAMLDYATVFFIAACVTVLIGALLVIAWLQQRDMRALAWWGAAYLIGGSSIALWSAPAGLLPLPAEFASALIFIACGMIWNGVRLFHGRRLLPVLTFAGAVAWLIGCQAPGFSEGSSARVGLATVVVAAYTFCIALELWRERRKTLFSRTAAVIVPVLHATIFLVPIAMKTLSSADSAIANGWTEVLALETILYVIGAAFIMLIMVKDHDVHLHRSAASTDHLTGLFNRRAFLDSAERLIAQQTRRHEPVVLLMFDLDHFKSINDRFGHAVGDDALRLFAATARDNMRPSDLIGRLGGEEFAAIVPGALDVAEKIAERIRLKFQIAGARIGAHCLDATVSIGAACSVDAGNDIEVLLTRADAALYRAKVQGRNRLCVNGVETPADLAARIIAAARASNAAEAAAERQPPQTQPIKGRQSRGDAARERATATSRLLYQR